MHNATRRGRRRTCLRGRLPYRPFLFPTQFERDKKRLRNSRHNPDSNARKRRSSSHCWLAFSLDLRKSAQWVENLSAPSESCEQAETTRVKASGAFHKLSPGKKLCSRLVRTIRLRSA